MYMEDYKRWLEADLEDAALKTELEAIAGNEEEIKDRFAVALKFGTAGLRGVLGAVLHGCSGYGKDSLGQVVPLHRSAVGNVGSDRLRIHGSCCEYRLRSVLITYGNQAGSLEPAFFHAEACSWIGERP